MVKIVHQRPAIRDKAQAVGQAIFLPGFLGQRAVVRVVFGHQDGDRPCLPSIHCWASLPGGGWAG